MGPVLFTLYVNDLFRVPKHCEPLGYVDDTKLFLGFPSSELNDVISGENEDLKEISIWFCKNSLLINPDKTKPLLFGHPTTHEDFTYSLIKCDNAGNSNQACNSCKGPGVYIDYVILTLTTISLKLPLTVCLN